MTIYLIPKKDLPYNPDDINSVIKHAKKLEDSTLRKADSKFYKHTKEHNKGGMGQLTEELHFFLKNNNSPEPDFKNIELELKTAGLLETSHRDRHPNISGKWKVKEALPLSSINYNKIVNEKFSSSSFLKKNKKILLVLYKYEKLNVLDLEIKLTGILSYHDLSESDKEIIKRDWELMKSKTKLGKAHEFSRGDFEYLELAPSNNISSLTSQPFALQKARTRKYSFKQGFMHAVVGKLEKEKSNTLSINKLERINSSMHTPLAKLEQEKSNTLSLYKKSDKNISLSDKIKEKFNPYLGQDVNSIASSLGVSIEECKHKFSILSKRLLKAIFEVPENSKIESYIEEFSKAEISIKTIRINSKNFPKEHMSFPAFKFQEIVNQHWEASEFKNQIDKKFLFIFFKEFESSYILDEVIYWNMPSSDIDETKKVWEITKKLLKKGKIVKELKNKIRYTYFPSPKSNSVSHVRPHARNAKDTFFLPVKDQLTGLKEYTKHCFWLNKDYLKDEIYLKYKK